jgi:hypothetical protein
MVVINLHIAIVQVDCKCIPSLQIVVNRFGDGTTIWQALALQFQPFVQVLAQRLGTCLPCSRPTYLPRSLNLALDFVQCRNALYGLRAYRTEAIFVQFIRLTPRMGKVRCFNARLFLQYLVAAAIANADQGA